METCKKFSLFGNRIALSPAAIRAVNKVSKEQKIFRTWGYFLENPETFRAFFGYFYVNKLHNHFAFCDLENTFKDQLIKTSRRQLFRKWLLGPEKLSGLSRNRPLERRTFDLARNESCLKSFVKKLWKNKSIEITLDDRSIFKVE